MKYQLHDAKYIVKAATDLLEGIESLDTAYRTVTDGLTADYIEVVAKEQVKNIIGLLDIAAQNLRSEIND